MLRQSFNSDWTAGPKLTGFASINGSPGEAVTLPHDILRDLPRSDGPGRTEHTAYYPDGLFEHAKSFQVPEEWRDRTVRIEFEGVYRDAMVYINGQFAAQRPNGYAGFSIDAVPFLRYGQMNRITVESRTHEDSRWYTGVGIHRNTHLVVADLVHVPLDGVRVTTPQTDRDLASVLVATTVANGDRVTRTVRIETTIVAPDGTTAATNSAPITLLPGETGLSHVRLAVTTPELWSTDSPALYEVQTSISDGDAVLDQDISRFGIRTLQLDTAHGLRINGIPVKLRGAAVHHTNGPLGAATIARAEERRVEILKSAGFNAIRSAHNPISRAMLDACDRLGMLVMDELSDVWTVGKSAFDHSLSFPEWWERDLEAMVAKDFNHPSVILYSIGNEIIDIGQPLGAALGRRIAEKARALDGTRFTTNAINGMVAVLDQLGAMFDGGSAETSEPIDVNTMIANMGDLMANVSASEPVSQAIEESASAIDIVGLNYADSRYESDLIRYPNRITIGSETFPGHIDKLWRLVTAHPRVIGDFTWTGWDYLGESGIGRVDYTDEPGYVATGIAAPYPYLVSSTGDIDITGHRKPVSYYREIVYGLRAEPFIAVHRPQMHGRPTFTTPWSWSDSLASWSWDAAADSPVTVDVYSDADEIELFINGADVGRSTVGATKSFIATFEATYQPGEITAVAYRDGKAAERTTLRSAAPRTRLQAAVDRDVIRADDTDLAYVNITVEDEHGTLSNDQVRNIAVRVDGPGVLAALANADPRSEEAFGASDRRTYDGRAQAIIRPTGPGEITVTIFAAPDEELVLTLRAE